MPRNGNTQTRTFNYNTSGQLTSSVNPETGTVTYTYNTDSTLATKTDAKNQKVEYVYDAYKRVTEVKRYPVAGGAEDTCQKTKYFYDVNTFDGSFSLNAWGRLVVSEYPICSPAGLRTVREMYSYTEAGLVTKKRFRVDTQKDESPGQGTAGSAQLDASWTYNEGRTASTTYPSSAGLFTGSTFTYSFDAMGRATGLTETNVGVTWVSGLQYNASGQMTQFVYGGAGGVVETRQYNPLSQLTRITVQGGSTYADLEYRYSATQNNGRITQLKNWVSGEEVNYQYDALQRLSSASTTGPEWGLNFSYDGFGNKTGQTVTKGTGPAMSATFAPATNRMIGVPHDNNGNVLGTTGTLYDIENRTVTWDGAGSYGYAPDNRRVWRRYTAGGLTVEDYTLRGLNGKPMGTYRLMWDDNEGQDPWTLRWSMPTGDTTQVWFGSKEVKRPTAGGRLVHDRLGTSTEGIAHYPYGEAKAFGGGSGPSTGDWATYPGDATGLRYADQRYYSPAWGRFTSPDPSLSSNATVLPDNWNRYAYVGGDPINKHDPRGLCSPQDDPPCYSTTVEEMSAETRRAYEAWYDFLARVGQTQTTTMSAPPPPVTAEDHARQALPPALAVALSALANKEDCLELFGTAETRTAGFDPSTVLWALASGSEVKGRKLGRIDFIYNKPGATVTPDGNRIVFAVGGFKTSSATVRINPNAWNGYGADFNAHTLLHELGHVYDIVRGLGGSQIQSPDVIFGDDTRSKRNDWLLDQNCFGGRLGFQKPGG